MNTLSGNLLRMLLAFFAGALCMLIFLCPGKIPWRQILDERTRSSSVDFSAAAQRIETAHDQVLAWFQPPSGQGETKTAIR